MQEAVDVCRVSLNTTIWPLNYDTEMTKVPQGLIASHQQTLLESDRECGCSFSRTGSARHTVLGSTGSSGGWGGKPCRWTREGLTWQRCATIL